MAFLCFKNRSTTKFIKQQKIVFDDKSRLSNDLFRV